MKSVMAIVACSIALATPAWSGQPNWPGAGGVHIVIVDISTAKTLGITLPEYLGPRNIGPHVQAAKAGDGGAPDPDNDNGKGNDTGN